MYSMTKKLGFGCMRFPANDGVIDKNEVCRMFDIFIENGFNYFDTAHPYHGGNSELVIRECLTSRYPRESYLLANKLSGSCFNTEEEIRPFFEKQLEWCGVDYFDFYLMHSQSGNNYEKYQKCRAYEIASELVNEGRVKHLGISFHDKADMLERILSEHPEIEFVQIQFNYADYNSPSVESRKCYEVCRKYNKPVIVMEPVKGGSLARLPEAAEALLSALGGGSSASYALRFAADHEGILTVLSGMSSADMVLENVSVMKDVKPLDAIELDAIARVCDIFESRGLVQCTACRYCTDGCPSGIPIPDIFSCLNSKKVFNNWNSVFYYGVMTSKGGKASSCIGCGACEDICPQHLEIRALLSDAAKEFEKENG